MTWHEAAECAAEKEGSIMRLLLRGALSQPATVAQQTWNFVLASILYYVVAAIPVVVKMVADGNLNLPKTLTLWLTALSPFVVAILGIVIAALRGQPLPDPQPTPQPAPPAPGA